MSNERKQSKLEELIQKYCPEGVEYEELQSVLKIKNGSDYKAFDTGDIPVYGSGGIMTYIDRYMYDKPSVLIPRKGSIDKLYYVDTPFWNVDTIFYTEINTDLVIPRYVYHCLLREHLEQYNTAGGVPSLTQKVLNKIRIPVPPLPVQGEIVRILDNFTEFTAELTAELTARKKQYEYYRDALLTFDGVRNGVSSDVKWRTLGEVCSLQSGKAISSYLISDVQTAENHIPCYGANGLRGYVSTFNESSDKPIVGRQGALCGNVCFATGLYYATEHAVVVTDKGFFNNRFLYHLLVNADLNQYKTAGAQPGLSVKRLNEVKVPVPTRKIQDKIANVLDNFDAICSDLNIGLPAEIEARQKQYEYYRDALLTYAATGKTILTDRQTDRRV